MMTGPRVAPALSRNPPTEVVVSVAARKGGATGRHGRPKGPAGEPGGGKDTDERGQAKYPVERTNCSERGPPAQNTSGHGCLSQSRCDYCRVSDVEPLPSVPAAVLVDPVAETEPLRVLDGMALLRWAYTAVGYLAERQEELNALNVFPVPDGDTGTNLLHTLSSALESAAADDQRHAHSFTERLRRVSRDAMMAARGNSGVILSQLLVGFTESVEESHEDDERIGPRSVAAAMVAAASRARDGVRDPKDGTILSVARSAAEAAQRVAERLGGLAEVTSTAVEAARTSLAATTAQLEALSRAGVVDAGGAGLVTVLEALDDVVNLRSRNPGRKPAAPTTSGGACAGEPAGQPGPGGARSDREFEGELAYEVVYRLEDVPSEKVDELSGRLEELGDSVVVSGSSRVGDVVELVTVHVHTANVGGVIEAAHPLGLPSGIRLEPLHTATHAGTAGEARDRDEQEALPAPPAPPGVPVPGLGIVVAVRGEGLAELFREAGAQVVTPTRGDASWDPAQLLTETVTAIRASGSSHVLVLPGSAEATPALQSAAVRAEGSGIEVTVAGVHSPVQGLAALAVWDRDADPATEAARLAAVADGVTTGAVTVAPRSVTYAAGRVVRGDLVAYSEGDVRAVGADAVSVCLSLVHFCCGQLLSAPELITLVAGTGRLALVEEIGSLVAETWPDVEVVTIDGGDIGRVLRVGVE